MEPKRSVNLCSTYVLPLLGLNQWSFSNVADKYVNSYVSEDDKYIVVECTHPHSSIIIHNASYSFGFERDGHYFAVFNIPEFYKADIKKFREGKYSQYSDSAKNMIRKKSGLQYMVATSTGRFKSALKLLVLDKDKELRKKMEEDLDVKIDSNAELASIPGDDNFYNLKLSNKLESV